MNLYIAGIYTSNFSATSNVFRRLNEIEQDAIVSAEHLLESYHYIRGEQYINRIRDEGKKIFLDSGAFSAYTKGIHINIKDYCDYIIRNKDIILEDDGVLVASVLDAIGDPLQTWRNQRIMERLGAKPLPCYHFADGDERFLEEYVSKYDYITLGGMAVTSMGPLKIWLDRIWDKYLVDGAGRPKVKVHGFGLLSERMFKIYPWYSTDSASWVQLAMNGGIYIRDTKILKISTTSIQRKIDGTHYDNLPKPMQQTIADEIVARDWDVERLRTFNYSRWAYNIRVMNDINDKFRNADIRFKTKQRGLF